MWVLPVLSRVEALVSVADTDGDTQNSQCIIAQNLFLQHPHALGAFPCSAESSLCALLSVDAKQDKANSLPS